MRRRQTKSSRSEPRAPGGISVHDTINSGQVFLWERHGGSWFGVDGQDVLRVGGEPPVIESASGRGGEFFRSDDDIPGILSSIGRDGVVRGAVERFAGLRLLRQDPFQCYISFIASSNSSIQRIKGCLRRICRRYGRRTEFCGREFFLFPTPEEIAGCGIPGLAECGLGYRAEFVRQASGDVVDGRVDFGLLKKASYRRAKEVLVRTPGIGDKVADCIMLFSLDKLESFPLDRWMIRILEKYYPDISLGGRALTPRRYDELHRKVVEHFGPYAGYAQQFLFKMERELHRKGWLDP